MYLLEFYPLVMSAMLMSALILRCIVRHLYVGRLQDRYIFITGCDTGFGNVLAKRLDSLGCHVIAACLTSEGQTEVSRSASSRLVTIPLDVRSREMVNEAFKFVTSLLPPSTGLWGLVNNAGIYAPVIPTDFETLDTYKAVADVNLFGQISVTLTFLPLVKLARGRVVIMSSMAGRFSPGTQCPYHISKYGMQAFSDGLRRSVWRFGVRVSIIEPGAHDTCMIESHRLRAGYEQAWLDASPQLQQDYGYDFIRAYGERVISWTHLVSRRSMTDVTHAYHHALFGVAPKFHYMIGPDVYLLGWPLVMMPTWMSDFMFRLVDIGCPPPAAMRHASTLIGSTSHAQTVQ